MKFIDNAPLWLIVMVMIFLGIAPYPAETQPHAVQKIYMLLDGKLTKPLDIFDLVFHAVLMPTILVIKLVRMGMKKGSRDE